MSNLISATLTGALYTFDEGRATVNDLIESLNATLKEDDAKSPKWEKALHGTYPVYGALIKPNVSLIDELRSRNVRGLLVPRPILGHETTTGARFVYKGESYLLVEYINVKGEPDSKLFVA